MAEFCKETNQREVLLKSLDDCLNGTQHALSCKFLNRAHLEEDEFCRKNVKFSTFLEIEKKANSQQSSVRFTPENLYPDTSKPDWRSEKRFTRVISHLRQTKQVRTTTKKAKSSSVINCVAEDNLALLKEFTGRSTRPATTTGGSFRVVSTGCSQNLFGISETGKQTRGDSNRSFCRFPNQQVLNPNVVRCAGNGEGHIFRPSVFRLGLAKENDELSLNFEPMCSTRTVSFNQLMKSSLSQNLFRSKKNIGKRFGQKLDKNLHKSQTRNFAQNGENYARNGGRKPKRRKRRRRRNRKESFVIKKDFSQSVNARLKKSKLKFEPTKKSHLNSEPFETFSRSMIEGKMKLNVDQSPSWDSRSRVEDKRS